MSRGPVADGANTFRQPTALERIAKSVGGIVRSPAIRRRLKTIYLRALTMQTGGHGLAASLPGGETIRVLPAHAHMLWNPDEYRAFRSSVREGATALDVGANVGAYALLLGQWVGSSGAVFAFEPSPSTYDGLCGHVRLNGLERVVTPVRSAVAAASGNLPFVVDAGAGEGHLASRGEGAAITVPVTTIDLFCARQRIEPAFIKIDVEGLELDVLRGARETIARTRGRLALFVELHPSVWPRLGVTRADIEHELEAQHLAVQPLVEGVDHWTLEGLCVRLVPAS